MQIKLTITFFIIFILQKPIFGSSTFSKEEFSVIFFREPSIGGEYRYERLSIHGGYYVTNFEPGITTNFYKVGFRFGLIALGAKGESTELNPTPGISYSEFF